MEIVMFYLATNVPAHEAHVVEADPDEAWDGESGWTYQELAGVGFTVVGDGFETREEAEAAADEFLQCPAAEAGEYCYSHNPDGPSSPISSKSCGIPNRTTL